MLENAYHAKLRSKVIARRKSHRPYYRDRNWRGIGMIPASGWKLRPEFASFDAEQRFQVSQIQPAESPICIAGQILQGLKKPHQCPAFGSPCSPENPLGATMVSSEGACAAYYRYAPKPANSPIEQNEQR
jgi:hydrogenase expression/formation protein HypD